MSEKQLLLKYSNNYADEFDVEGFLVLSQSQWDEHKAKAAQRFEKVAKAAKVDPNVSEDSWLNRRAREVSVGFGTNEEVTYYSIDDYLGSFVVKELTQEQYQVLKDLFGVHYDSYSYEWDGKTITIPAQDKIENGMLCLINFEDEEEDEEDED